MISLANPRDITLIRIVLHTNRSFELDFLYAWSNNILTFFLSTTCCQDCHQNAKSGKYN